MFEKITLFLQNISLGDIFDFIVNPPDEGIYLYLKVVFIIISLILLAGTIPLFMLSDWRKHRFEADTTEFLTYRPFGAKKTFKQWAKVSKRLESGKEAEYKLAVIEVDSLLEESLEIMGYTGETMEERLEKVDSAILPNKEQILKARKIRNSIVHNPDYELTSDEAKKTAGIYEEALRSLDVF